MIEGKGVSEQELTDHIAKEEGLQPGAVKPEVPAPVSSLPAEQADAHWASSATRSTSQSKRKPAKWIGTVGLTVCVIDEDQSSR